MISKKLKYREYLEKFPDCPSSDFREMEKLSFRWVHKPLIENDFKPLNLINEPPPRVLESVDLMCMGYGLSLFDSVKNAIEKYRKEYERKRSHQKEQFRIDKGEYICTIQLCVTDGKGNEPSEHNFGHFTFHEYEETDLTSKVVSFLNIFDSDGNITS